MKVIMYGAPICGDCVWAKDLLSKNPTIDLEYRSITESTTTMKEFLAYRDQDAMFEPVKAEGRIGIPFFLLEDGRKTFDVADFMDVSEEEMGVNTSSCSIDGKGNC